MNAFLKTHNSRIVLLVVLIVLFLFAGNFVEIDEATYQSYLTQFPIALSGFIFVFLYVVVTFFVWLGPKDLFRITSVLLYGAGLSTLLVFIGETINVIVLFSLSRHLGRGYVESKLQGNMKRLDEVIVETSFWSVFLLKAFPVIPFRFLDLGFGLTKISLKKYFVISFLASPLRVFMTQFFLSLGAEIYMNPFKLQAYLEQHPWIMLGMFSYLAGSLFVIYLLKKRAERRKGV